MGLSADDHFADKFQPYHGMRTNHTHIGYVLKYKPLFERMGKSVKLLNVSWRYPHKTKAFVAQMANLDHLWENCVKVFPILENSWEISNDITESNVQYVVGELVQLSLAESILETIWLNIDYVLRHKIVPRFWEHFNTGDDNENGFYQFQMSIDRLYQEHRKFEKMLERVKPLKMKCKFAGITEPLKCELKVFKGMLRSAILSQLPVNFTKIVHSFYQISFNVFANRQDADPDMMDDVRCSGCNKETESCRCDALVVAFNDTNRYLYEMDLLDRLAGYTLTNLIQERIDTHVTDTCKGSLDTSHLENLLSWLDSVVLNWLTRIYDHASSESDESRERVKTVLREFRVKLEYYLYDTYAHMIIDQFFTVIVDFPDSKAAVDDLKSCLAKIDLRMFLVKTIKDVLEKRLLHPGVNTKDILTGYVAAIKTIRHLDNTGVLLDTISEPVKQYMRSRPDTVRCVVSSLTEDSPTYLAEELAQSKMFGDNLATKDDDWESWQPDPIDASLKLYKSIIRSPDIISMVVDIYGSKEIFVNEYRNLLADRLLAQLDFETTRELANLEHLKLRFDESMLHTCDVMLKDISDSKRINAHIHSTLYDEKATVLSFKLSSLILSSQFWPPFKTTYTPELPAELQCAFEVYTKQYEAYKGNRSLVWRPSIGRVELELEIGNKKMELKVSTVHAIIIYAFQEQSKWRLDELSQKIRVPTSVVRKKISYWLSKRVLEETEYDVFELTSTPSTSGGYQPQHGYQHDVEDDENESAMASSNDQREEELQVFWSYIVGMLTNLDSMPLERIHQMLRMFASHGPGVEFSQEELKNFLQRKVREHALVFTAGVYQLPK